MIARMYQARIPSRSAFTPVRTLDYHVRIWGDPAPHKTPLVMLHGWMDVGASFQFVVDALSPSHYVIAPDWRGFGQTAVPATDNFWFPDYLADLDSLLNHYAADRPVHLIGHSMGGNIAMLYAGVRPQRVARLINLEGFGMPATHPEQAPARYAQWLDGIQQVHQGTRDMRSHDSLQSVARRLMKTNPRLAPDRAEWLAQHWAREEAPGQWRIQGHPAHRTPSAQLYRADEVLEIHKCISAPTLAVEASDDSLAQWWNGTYTLAQYHQRIQVVRQLEIARIDHAGHMLHHDQPEAVAALIEGFIA